VYLLSLLLVKAPVSLVLAHLLDALLHNGKKKQKAKNESRVNAPVIGQKISI